MQSRAAAIDTLAKRIREVQPSELLNPALPRLVQFLCSLVTDPNFKISISSER